MGDTNQSVASNVYSLADYRKRRDATLKGTNLALANDPCPENPFDFIHCPIDVAYDPRLDRMQTRTSFYAQMAQKGYVHIADTKAVTEKVLAQIAIDHTPASIFVSGIVFETYFSNSVFELVHSVREREMETRLSRYAATQDTKDLDALVEHANYYDTNYLRQGWSSIWIQPNEATK